MEKLDLQPNEAPVLKAENVAYGDSSSFSNELVLTNLNLILIKKGFFGKTKDVLYFPLNEIKIVNNKVQALAGKRKNGNSQLEVYFRSGDVQCFSFNVAIMRMEVAKWANAICNQLSQGIEDGYNPNAFAIPGAKAVAESLKGTVDTFKTVFGKKSEQDLAKSKRAVFCQNCGASFEGIKGSTAKCPFCESVQFVN